MIILSDCVEGLKGLPDKSVNCCVTSPPYFGLRDYGHAGQIGLEKTPELYVAKMVEVFEEVRRVLKDDGTLWLNLGDSYAASAKNRTEKQSLEKSTLEGGRDTQLKALCQPDKVVSGLKPKDLIGIPWRVAFALQAAGWYLRQDIIWHKPNPMPESVTDRCTKAHEYIFLLSKSPKYYYDHEAIKVPIADSVKNDKRLYKDDYETGRPERGYPGAASKGGGHLKARKSGNLARKAGTERGCPEGTGSNVCGSVPWEGFTANRKSVWKVSTKPFKGAHFATFPPDLIEPCILAGCPVGGVVLDPFGGAGTTGVVCVRNDRNYLLIEINPEYKALAEQRIADEEIKMLL